MTDQELIEGLLRHERKAFQFLVSKYQRNVIKTAYYFLGNMAEAEDLSQEIFLEIIRSVSTFRKASSLDTWIYRITVNRSLNELKRIKRRGFFLRLETFFGLTADHQLKEPGSDVTSKHHEDKENSKLLHTAINLLPENQRIAFVLHKFDDKSYQQISEIMNLSLSAVESLMFRAKANLHRQLKPHFSEFNKN